MRTHRLDLLSLVFGLVFVVLAILGLVDAVSLSARDVRLLGPAVFVLAGLALVISAARGRADEPFEPSSIDDPVTLEPDDEIVSEGLDR